MAGFEVRRRVTDEDQRVSSAALSRGTKRTRTRAVAWALTTALAGAATPPAAAEPTSTRLTLERAEGTGSCPGEAELRADVAARLGHDPFAPDAPTATHVTWWRDARGKLLARVVRTGEDGAPLGSRTLESDAEDCAELASATSFAIALAIDPSSIIRAAAAPPTSPDVAPADGAPAPPTVPPPPAAPLAPRPPAPPRQVDSQGRAAPTKPPAADDDRGPWIFAGVSAHAALLAAPDVAPGGAIHAGLRNDRLSVAAEGRLDAEARGADDGAAGEIGTRLALAALIPCGHLGPAALCAVAAVGSLEAQGYGVDRPEDDGTVVAAFGPRLAVELRVSRLGLFAQGDLLVTVPRATVELDGEPAYRQPAAHVALGVGARVHLPELGKSSGR